MIPPTIFENIGGQWKHRWVCKRTDTARSPLALILAIITKHLVMEDSGCVSNLHRGVSNLHRGVSDLHRGVSKTGVSHQGWLQDTPCLTHYLPVVTHTKTFNQQPIIATALKQPVDERENKKLKISLWNGDVSGVFHRGVSECLAGGVSKTGVSHRRCLQDRRECLIAHD